MMENCPVVQSCRGFGYDCLDCCGGLPPEEGVNSTLPLLYRKYLPGDPEHPVVQLRKEQRESAKKVERARKQSTAFRQKSQLVKRAFKTEKQTRSEIIRATHRSGASNGDGDSRLGDGQWGVDDKLKSTSATQFTITVSEIAKAHDQHCIIIVTLSSGMKYVVAELDDFCSATKALTAACEKAVQ